MKIEHEVDQRPFETCADTPINSEASPRHFGSTLHVQNVQLRSEIPVRFRLESEFARRSPTPHFDIVPFVFPNRHAVVGQVRNVRQEIAKFGVQH
jgi:hypothetical protein